MNKAKRGKASQMTNCKTVLIVEENSSVPLDKRVWYEATTLRDSGWQVAVICPRTPSVPSDGKEIDWTHTPEILEGVCVYRFPQVRAQQGILGYLSEYLSAFLAIARGSWCVWKEHHFDVIHFCNPPDIFSPVATFYRLLGVGVVFDHHDLFPELVLWRYHGMIARVFYAAARLGEYLTFRSANAVISTNESYRRIAIDRGKVPSDHIVVVRNGPRKDKFVSVNPVPSLKRGFAYMAAYAGVMGPEDGVIELLQSIRYLAQDLGRRDILFVLLGDGAVRARAQADSIAWGIEGMVDFPGMIRDDLLLRQYLSTADLLLSPEPLTPLNVRSTFIKVGEYMAMGKPIVAYELPETQHTAQDAAIYVQPGDTQAFGRAILTLLEDPHRSRCMGEFGQKRIVESLSWEHQQSELLRAYAIALGERASTFSTH
jgi:glycosyltransferase involved in cell wall biosynthesis